MASPVYLDARQRGGTVLHPGRRRRRRGRARRTAPAPGRRASARPPPAASGAPASTTTPPLGLLSTPVIDAASKTIYVAGIVGEQLGRHAPDRQRDRHHHRHGQVRMAGQRRHRRVVRSQDSQPAQRAVVGERHPLHPVRRLRGRLRQLPRPRRGGQHHQPATVGQWTAGDMGDGIWASGGLAVRRHQRLRVDRQPVAAQRHLHHPHGQRRGGPRHRDGDEVRLLHPIRRLGQVGWHRRGPGREQPDGHQRAGRDAFEAGRGESPRAATGTCSMPRSSGTPTQPAGGHCLFALATAPARPSSALPRRTRRRWEPTWS